MTRRSFWLGVGALVVMILVGCAEPGPIPGARPDLLGFLKEGQTRRDEAILALGQPSATFEKESIITYRVGHDAKQGYFIVSPRELQPWANARYSLVLVFDDKGVLRAHTLVPVQ
ncbi:MAG: hypothetical protein WBC37_15620 [Burkholderiaceae bacterium]